MCVVNHKLTSVWSGGDQVNSRSTHCNIFSGYLCTQTNVTATHYCCIWFPYSRIMESHASPFYIMDEISCKAFLHYWLNSKVLSTLLVKSHASPFYNMDGIPCKPFSTLLVKFCASLFYITDEIHMQALSAFLNYCAGNLPIMQLCHREGWLCEVFMFYSIKNVLKLNLCMLLINIKFSSEIRYTGTCSAFL